MSGGRGSGHGVNDTRRVRRKCWTSPVPSSWRFWRLARPGGGGAAAFGGAIGMALGNMVGNLTVGKKKYTEVENEVKVGV